MNGLEEHMQDCGLEENIINDFKDGISHGILVGNLTFDLCACKKAGHERR